MSGSLPKFTSFVRNPVPQPHRLQAELDSLVGSSTQAAAMSDRLQDAQAVIASLKTRLATQDTEVTKAHPLSTHDLFSSPD